MSQRVVHNVVKTKLLPCRCKMFILSKASPWQIHSIKHGCYLANYTLVTEVLFIGTVTLRPLYTEF